MELFPLFLLMAQARQRYSFYHIIDVHMLCTVLVHMQYTIVGLRYTQYTVSAYAIHSIPQEHLRSTVLNLSSDTNFEKSFWWIFILFRTLMIYMELVQVTKATEILDIILQSFNKLSISRDSSFKGIDRPFGRGVESRLI